MNTFQYKQPSRLKDASKMLGDTWSDATAYAGGTDVLGLIKDHIVSPKAVINLKSIPGMDKIEYQQGKGLNIGALVTVTEIAENTIINEKYPALAEAAKNVASPQLRNQGTIGGNICQRPRCWYFRGDFPCLRKGGDECFAVGAENKFHCIIGGNPCFIIHPSDMSVALLAYGADLSIFTGRKEKTVAFRDFFILPEQDPTRENILQPGDIVTAVYVPEPASNTVSGFLKVKERDVWDFAVVNVAASLQVEANVIRQADVVIGGVAPKPWYETNLSQQLVNQPAGSDTLEKLTGTILADAEPMQHNEYKITLTRNLTKKLLLQLTS